MSTIPGLKLEDVRDQMPNYEIYKDWQRSGEILGIAIHHSATADRKTGAPLGDAKLFFDYHVNSRGWTHGGYSYVILSDGTVQYALDENIAGYHAGFKDPDDSFHLEKGQYWNNHYIAICLAGWFSSGRTWRDSQDRIHPYPEAYTTPTPAQMEALVTLVQHLMRKYGIPVKNVRGHRELTGANTQCPGLNFDLDAFRERLKAAITIAASPERPPLVSAGEHVLVFWSRPDGSWAREDFSGAINYIERFQPDITFHPEGVPGRWKAATIVGGPEGVTPQQEQALIEAGLIKVERVANVALLDELAAKGQRFSEKPKEPEVTFYTVQPGDTLGIIAKRFYGDGRRWPTIFQANREIISDPSLIQPGQKIRIP